MLSQSIQKVVIVNGTAEMLETVEAALDAGHYDIVFVESGAHAYTQIKNVQPDLVILCLCLTDGDGFRVLSMLKMDEETRDIPVLTYTTGTGTGTTVRSARANRGRSRPYGPRAPHELICYSAREWHSQETRPRSKREDLREGERIQILGELHGEVMVFQPMAVKEISRGGAQSRNEVSLQLDSLHELRLTLGDRSVVVKARGRALQHRRCRSGTGDVQVRRRIRGSFRPGALGHLRVHGVDQRQPAGAVESERRRRTPRCSR